MHQEKKQGVEETGDTQKATGPKEELQMLQGRKDFRDRTSHRTQTSLTQLPTEHFIFCFGKIKGNLHICLILPKLMGKIPHLQSKVKTLANPFTMFSTQLSLKLSSVFLFCFSDYITRAYSAIHSYCSPSSLQL